MIDAAGTWHENTTCRACRRRHPAAWTCTQAKMHARAALEQRRAAYQRRADFATPNDFEDTDMNINLCPPTNAPLPIPRVEYSGSSASLVPYINCLIDAVNALRTSQGAARVAEVADAIGPMIDHRGWAKVTVAGLPAGPKAKEHAPRHGLAWTVAESVDLVRSHLLGASHQQLADTHQRTVGGCTSHLAAVMRASGGAESLAKSLVSAWARGRQEDES